MQRLTVNELNRLGDASGFRYRLPGLPSALAGDETLCVAEGRVQQRSLPSGLTLVVSDIVTHHAYEASSESAPYLSAIVMLQGQASTRVGRGEDVRMQAGRGAIALGNGGPLTGVHAAGQRLRSINVSLADPSLLGDEELQHSLRRLTANGGRRLRAWSVPAHLAVAIEQLFQGTWQGPLQRMLCEGIGLQVVASALHDVQQPMAAAAPATQRDRQHLQRVRELLHDAPGADHTLESLARVACMSPSSLRSKFQQVYQRSVFAWLRERRLEVAREQLAKGWSVQQAAHYVGYRHATNFATAFRQRYGVAPSRLCDQRP